MKISEMSVDLVDYMGDDVSIVNAARVSFAKVSESFSAKDEKLINYLAVHNHWSPFAHAFLSFRIKAPIFVARQLVKHQVGLSWNEESRRYVDEEPEFWFPKEWRGKPDNAKQGSSGVFDPKQPSYDLDVSVRWACRDSLALYKEAIKDGLAPEQARMILPLNTMTNWIWSGSLYAFLRVCKQRMDSHAQAETREIAEKIYQHLVALFPSSTKAVLSLNE